ncbi:lipase domain protein [Novymonas esmeraldas]|uniref:Lipase domain protein n=1 Tax=Novymonas esmeraldas TaxID=1808958 RepID=A0AAW0F1I8_9TRYP
MPSAGAGTRDGAGASAAPPPPPLAPSSRRPEAPAAAHRGDRHVPRAARRDRDGASDGAAGAARRRRVIPAAPHRQLFLVDGCYYGAAPLETPQRQTSSSAYPAGNVVERGASQALSNRITTDASATVTGLSFYVPPTAPCGVDMPHSHAAAAASLTPPGQHPAVPPPLPPGSPSGGSGDGGGDGRQHRHQHQRRPGKLRVRQRFYEPVELQVESISAFAMRLTLVLWYACLVAALVVEVVPSVQWSMVNLCGSADAVDLRYMEKWTSPCVVATPSAAVSASSPGAPPATVSLRWSGADLSHQSTSLVRYRRIAFSLPTPATQTSPVEVYDLVAETRMSGDGVESAAEFAFAMRCERAKARCDVARVPELLLGSVPAFVSEISFALTGVPESLAAGAANGAVGVAYQRSAYTVATLVWRYVLIVLSLLHTLRFIAYRKYTSTLHEQSWTLILQIALLWYLDPLFTLNVVSWPLPSVLAFLEYRMPTYFMAVLIAYMLSVMTASMAWGRPATARPGDGVAARLKAFLAHSSSVYDPPRWTKVLICAYMLSIFVLDIVDACVDKDPWYSASNGETHFNQRYWAIIALHLAGGLVCLLLLFYLRNYLGSKSYLESRPQQLACRVFLMVFLSAIVYYTIHCLVFFLLYNRGYPALASQQPFLQLPALMVASFFVNIMTLAYTSQNRDESVPINPRDPRWKHMVWPDTWYRWLARHGGSQYIFATEHEETRFYRLQFEFRRRQFMAKEKRRRAAGGAQPSLAPSLTDSITAAAPIASATVPALWERQQSATLSFLRSPESAGHRAAQRSSDRRGVGARAPWRGDVWETPLPSRPASASDADEDGGPEGAGGDRRGGESPDAHGVSCGSGSAPPRHDDPPGRPSTHGAARAAGASHSLPNGSFRQHRGDGVMHDLTPVNLAARHIINMDRFSTYFLADGDGSTGVSGRAADGDGADGGGGGRRSTGRSGGAQSYSGFTRDMSSAGDAYAVEGPARRRSRLLQQGARTLGGPIKGDGGGGDTATRQADAAGRPPQSPVPLHHHHNARSRSDGDVPAFALNDGAAETEMRCCTAAPHQTQSPPPPLRHRDPAAGATTALAREPPNTTASASASLPRPPGAVDAPREGAGLPCEEQQLCDSIDVTSSHNASFVRQRDYLLQAMMQLQQSTSPATGGGDDADAVPLLPHFPPTLADGADRRHHAQHGSGSGGHLRGWVAGHDDALSDLSLPTDASASSSSSSSSSGSGGGDGDSSRRLRRRSRHRHGHSGPRSFLRTLTHARERIGAWMGTAERHLVEGPVRGLDRLETHIFNAAYRPFQTIQYLPFFNLETAIDCFNISWEAYGVEESTGDHAIETGIKVSPQNVPRTVAHGVKKVICGCCPAEEDTSDDAEEDDDGASEADGAEAAVQPTAAQDSGDNNNNSGSGGGGGREVQPRVSPRRRHSDTVVVHMRGDGRADAAAASVAPPQASADDATPAAAAAAPAAASSAPPPRSAPSLPVHPESGAAAPTAATTAVPDPAALPINVEKYGFVRLLVAEAREVQVLMVRMDTTAPEHAGKAPRVIIGFRGTANVSNAKYDMNIHRIVWREMERAADREAAGEMLEETAEAASSFHDGSTTAAAAHLGCASCLHACTRKTSWRPTCHAGFLTIWKTLRPTVLSRLRDLLRDDRGTVYRVFTTGHSLGGALASLCAYSVTCMLRRMDYPITDVTVYTFGQPRLGNHTFQRLYNKAVPRSFRIVNESDVIVSMTMFGGYHVGIEVDVDRNGNFIVKPTEIEKLFPPTKGRGLAVVNHLMTNYGISLNAIASRTLCPARGLAFYLTADPAKVEEERRRLDAIHAAVQ